MKKMKNTNKLKIILKELFYIMKLYEKENDKLKQLNINGVNGFNIK